jgi:hypothetical protein
LASAASSKNVILSKVCIPFVACDAKHYRIEKDYETKRARPALMPSEGA